MVRRKSTVSVVEGVQILPAVVLVALCAFVCGSVWLGTVCGGYMFGSDRFGLFWAFIRFVEL